MKSSDILGMNARNHLYQSRYNRKAGKRIADSKLLTKSLLRKNKLPVPKLFRVFRKEKEVEVFNFSRLPSSFVVKPSGGLGGEGIVVMEKGGLYAGEWIDVTGKIWKIEDLKLLIKDIILGRYSMKNLPDHAFVEERVGIHPKFQRITYQGTPDIGILVFNRVPVMAFLRLPTSESAGKANMFQGAIACGIDIATGITTRAIKHTHEVIFYPGTRRKLRGIQIPLWNEALQLAVEASIVSGLGYMRADIVIDPVKGLRVLELNAQPGLKIQLANQAGLRKRLERVEGLKVANAKKGVKIARALFANPDIADKVGEDKKIISVFEEVEAVDYSGERRKVKAKIDTGAFRTSIDRGLAEELGLLAPENILWRSGYRSSFGREERPVVELTFYLRETKIKTAVNVADRSNLKRRMIIGRRDLKDFLIKTGKN